MDIASRSRRFQAGALHELSNVAVHLGTTVEELDEHAAIFCTDGRHWELDGIDIVVPTRTLLPVTKVADELYARDDAAPVFLLGDCVQPRTALEAIHDAAALGHRL